MSRLLVILSVVFNLCFLLYLGRSKPNPVQNRTDHFQQEAKSLSKKVASVPPNISVTPSTNHFSWAQLESEDYRTYIMRLRAVGCPEQTIRDLIIADLDKLMAPKLRALNTKTNPPKYWKSDWADFSPLRSLEALNQESVINDEKRGVIRDLLGIDLAAERLRQKGETDNIEQRLGFLEETKRAQVRSIMEKANREEIYLREKSWIENDDLTEEENARLKKIQLEKSTAIESILTPAELNQYNLWYSDSASRARDALTGMENTEQEFLGVYHIQRQFDDRWADINPASLSGPEKLEYDQAQQDYNNQMRDLLGNDRYAAVQKRRDQSYRELARTAEQFGLMPNVVEDVYAFKAAAQTQRNVIGSNSSLSPSQKIALQNAITEETERAVIDAMGPKPFKSYLRSGAADWITKGN